MKKNCQSFETKKLGPKKQQQKNLASNQCFFQQILSKISTKIEDVEFSIVNSTSFPFFGEYFPKFCYQKFS